MAYFLPFRFGCIYVCSSSHRFLLVSFPPDGLLVWDVSINVVRGSSDRSLIVSKFVLGGGGKVVIGCLYILRMVLVPGVMYCAWNRSNTIVVFCLLCVGRVRDSDRGSLATARVWRWRLPSGEWCL